MELKSEKAFRIADLILLLSGGDYLRRGDGRTQALAEEINGTSATI